jgi:hypothetical protein
MFDKELKYLCDSIALIESETDRWGWGNAGEDEPAFVAYIGFHDREEAIEYFEKDLKKLCRCTQATIRRSKRMKGFEWELKTSDLQRYTDSHAEGLDWLVDRRIIREEYDPNWGKPKQRQLSLAIAC